MCNQICTNRIPDPENIPPRVTNRMPDPEKIPPRVTNRMPDPENIPPRVTNRMPDPENIQSPVLLYLILKVTPPSPPLKRMHRL
jgi:hypothetical protein